MSQEIEYIEPTQEHVGQVVEVRDRKDREWQGAKLTGILADEFMFAAKRTIDASSWGWKYARIPRQLTYAERQARCGLKVGDRVKFVKAWEGDDNGGTVNFVHSMESYIGKIGSLTSMSKSSCCVHFDGGGYWYFPYFALEKVEDGQATIDDLGREVYIVPDYGNTFIFEAFYGAPGNPWRAVVRSGDKRFVYELSNLRVKE